MRAVTTIFNDLESPFLIAEVGLSHDGSLGTAHAFIDAIARTGVDAVKFQTHIAEAESSSAESFRVKFSPADATRFDYWKRTSFTLEQWAGLKLHAEERGLTFLSSPFSLEAVDLLARLGVTAWKVPSGELGSRRMLERMAATGSPLLVSTGMSGYDDLLPLVQRLRILCPGNFALFQCTTAYPTPPDAVGLNVIEEYIRRFDCPVGLSDHSGTLFPAVIATWMGARVIEVHATLSRDMFGPDVSSSLTIDNLCQLVEGVRYAHAMRLNPVDKNAAAVEKQPLRRLFGKSAAARVNLAAGEIISDDAVTFLKPGGGLSEDDFEPFLGRRLSRSVAIGQFFIREDFEL